MSTPRVRFAPSPTGPLHIGGVRTALYNYLFAKKLGGTFILRIEDTDQKRFVEGAEAYIQEALNWLGLSIDEGPEQGGDFGPYKQSERTPHYQQAVQKLLDEGKAYYAFDTPEALDQARSQAEANGEVFKYDSKSRVSLDNSLNLSAEDLKKRLDNGEAAVVRLKVEPNQAVVFNDLIRNQVSFQSELLDDKVLLKADGLPTYHLANVVDDHHMKITHVIRGEEWLSSTAHHVLLYRALGIEDQMPAFAHLPLILKPQGKGKLSKRDGAKFGIPVFPLDWKASEEETYQGFRENGFLPQAVLNFLAFLGWNPGTEQEMFSLEALIDAFTIERINKSGARFDYDRAVWYNQQYIQQLADKDFAEIVMHEAKEKGVDACTSYVEQIAPLIKDRIKVFGNVTDEQHYFFSNPDTYNDKQALKRAKKISQAELEAVTTLLEGIDDWKKDNIEQQLKTWANEQEIKLGVLLPLYRIALTGDMTGPDVFEMSEVIGKEYILDRWKNAVKHYTSIVKAAEN